MVTDWPAGATGFAKQHPLLPSQRFASRGGMQSNVRCILFAFTLLIFIFLTPCVAVLFCLFVQAKEDRRAEKRAKALRKAEKRGKKEKAAAAAATENGAGKRGGGVRRRRRGGGDSDSSEDDTVVRARRARPEAEVVSTVLFFPPSSFSEGVGLRLDAVVLATPLAVLLISPSSANMACTREDASQRWEGTQAIFCLGLAGFGRLLSRCNALCRKTRNITPHDL